jgi:hypothetical protein
MKQYSILVTAVCFLTTFFITACTKTKTGNRPVPGCAGIRPHDGFIRCNSRRVTPALGTVYYKNQLREFTTVGPNKQCYVPDVTDSNGTLIISGIPYANQIIYSGSDSSVTFGFHCNGGAVPLVVRKPENNWYDSCKGILYLDYYWVNSAQSYMCDTCYF